MSQHIQTMSKEHYYNWCKHRNNQCHYNCLILGNYKSYQNKNHGMENR